MQRGVLKASCEAPGAIDTKNWPTALEDIDWLLEKTRGVADQRNAALCPIYGWDGDNYQRNDNYVRFLSPQSIFKTT